MVLNPIWFEKYRPTTFADYVFGDTKFASKVAEMLEQQTIPNLLLSGVQGTGKTTAARILLSELGVFESDVLKLNASDDNSIDVIREQVVGFTDTMPYGAFKVVLLEEADYISKNAQGALRALMEECSSDTRFILTCNYVNKLDPAIRSRCQQFHFGKHSLSKVMKRMIAILDAEQVKYDVDDVAMYVGTNLPDVRSIVQTLEQNSINGTLQPYTDSSATGGNFESLIAAIESGTIKSFKQNLPNIAETEWDEFYQCLYETIDRCNTITEPSQLDCAYVVIAKYAYQNAIVADKEINAYACLIELEGATK